MTENTNKNYLTVKPTFSSIFNLCVKKNFKGLDWEILGLHESGIIENITKYDENISEDIYSGFGRWK